MAEITNIKDIRDSINLNNLIEFLEYEEALSNDPATKARIRQLLIKIGIWDNDGK